jgi:ATP-dependent protease ClpP protease subunit
MSSSQVHSYLGAPRGSVNLDGISLEGFCAQGSQTANWVKVAYDNDIVFKVIELDKIGYCHYYIAADLNELREVSRERIVDVSKVAAEELLRKESIRAARFKEDEYFIDGLVITTIEDTSSSCAKGGVYTIEVVGDVGPDSSFALGELLKRSGHCLNDSGEVLQRTTVVLSSMGGLLKDGYEMGRSIRLHEVATKIAGDSICASSCAVAFLGGTQRLMDPEAYIMFHSPYLTAVNSAGQLEANCDVPEELLDDLLSYYKEITDEETGDRLFDRTLSYCSSKDGWLIKGENAAKLFGIVT